ncbi:MAG: hypothetical protein GY711_10615 [bacterium]|nr:hypothetical protein [bacterium]
MLRSLIASALALVLASSLAFGQVIASDSFDYPVGNLGGSNGGVGWIGPWDGGGNALVAAPGMDAVGNLARIDPNNGTATSFRVVDTAPWGALTNNGRFGVDGTSIWFSFRAQRTAGSAPEFGGFSLFDVTAERLFIGSPWGSGVWGADDHAGTGAHQIPGSNIDVPTHIVARIDYQANMNRLRVWLDPGVDFPTGPAGLDTIIGNHSWDRVRIASGTSVPNGYDFDDIRITAETGGAIGMSYCGPAIPNSSGQPGLISASGSTLISQNNVTLTAEALPAGQFGYFLAGETQGFFNPPGSQGIICLAGNIGRYNQAANIIQGPMGSITIDLTAIPVNPPTAVASGETWNFQCWYRDNNPTVTSNFTDGISIQFQ